MASTSLDTSPAPDNRAMRLGLFSCFTKRPRRATPDKSLSHASSSAGGSATDTESGISTPRPRSVIPQKTIKEQTQPARQQQQEKQEKQEQQQQQQQQPQTQSTIPSQRNPGAVAVVGSKKDAEMPKAAKGAKAPSKRATGKPYSKFFNNAGNAESHTEKVETKLNSMFDGLLTEEEKNDGTKDSIGMEAIQKYAGQLHADMANFEFFVVADIVQVESFGQITRKGYVEGWKAAYVNSGVEPDPSAHRRHVRSCIDRLSRDPAYFKQVYRRAFFVGKEPNQKAINKEIALNFWEALFAPGAKTWQSGGVNWLECWQRFLEDKWKRGVNKDMWNQTLEFALKTIEDPTLSFWSEESAWPSVIDDFVAWCRQEGIVKSDASGTGSGGMEVDY